MAFTVGQIAEFQPDTESIETYEERIRMFLEANEIPQERRVPVFLSVIGATNFALITTLVAPEKPSDKSVDELLWTLRTHFTQKRVTIAERFKFYNRSQGESESAAQYAGELRRLAVHCNFGHFLEQALRDRFVCGLRNIAAQRKLLSGEDRAEDEKITFKLAVEVASTMEAVETDVRELNSRKDGPVLNLQSKSQSCFRCGRDGHTPRECRFRGATCRRCGKRGHIQVVCRSAAINIKSKGPPPRSAPVRKLAGTEPDATSRTDDEDSSEDMGMFKLYANTLKSAPPPIVVTMNLNGHAVQMEVDTGAAVSIVSEPVYKKYLSLLSLEAADLQLHTYTNEKLRLLGKCLVAVKYGSQCVESYIYVVTGQGPSLLGRDILQHIRLDWPRIAHTRVRSVCDSLLKEFPEVFTDQLGAFKHHHATLHLKEGTSPRYHRPRTIPFALKDSVETEIQRLVREGILEPVNSSEWAAPIVVVPKKDGRLRICGDYKELFASLAGGKLFTKLDLSQAYQQMRLDDSSKELVTINTHKGLFRYTRLPFGVASAPAIFQRAMDNIMQGVSDEEHIRNLRTVLQRLRDNGITLKVSKCQFLQESVEYLGHVVDQEGLHTAPSKLTAIRNAPTPKNIRYRRTKDHGNADGLSRLPLPISPPSKPDVVSKFHLVHMSSLPLTHIQLRSASRADPVVSKVMTYTLQGWPQFVQDELQVYWRRRMELTVEADCLMWGLRVVVPEKCRKKILEELHEGHPGVVRMKSQARSHVWWPGIDHDIENLVKACSPCIQIKSDPSPVPLHPWVWPSRPWYRLHVDFAGPLFDKTYLVVVDAYSKWPEVWEMGSTSSAKTIEVMQQLFSKYGLPEQIVSDNGPQFRSSEFGEFLSQLGVKHYRSAVYHPATNGQVERFVKTLKQALKAGYLEGQPGKRTLLNFMLQYRSTPHTVTGSSPGQLFLGRPLRTKLDLLRPDHRKRVEQQQDKQKYYHDERRRRQMSLSPGDRVWIRMYRKGLHRWEQGQVQQIIGTRLVHILLSTGEQVTRHMDQIQRAKDIEEEQTYSSDNDVDIEIGLNHEPLLNEAPTGSPEAQSPSPPATCTRRYPDRVRRPPNRPWFVNDF